MMQSGVVKDQLEKELLQPCVNVDNSSRESPLQGSSKLNVLISSSSSSSPPALLIHKKRKHSTRSDNVTVVDVDPSKYASDTVSALHLSFVQSDRLLLTLIRGLLSRLNTSSDSASQTFANALCASGFFKLLPRLLLHSSFNVAKKSAEALSLLAISSYEVNCQLATEKEILVALAHLLSTAEFDVLLAAIHAILNVTTTSLGCTALREVAGLPEQLLRLVSVLAGTLHGFVQSVNDDIFGNSRKYVDIVECTEASETVEEKLRDHRMSREEKPDFLHLASDEAIELFDLVLTTLNTLFQDVGVLHLSGVPQPLRRLRRLWKSIRQLHSQSDVAFFDTTNHGSTVESILEPRLRSQLAKLIMMLAMEASVDVEANSMHARNLFSKELCSVEHFFQKHWELSPAQITVPSEMNALSRFFEKIAGCSPVGLLGYLVDTVTACPPAVADELDLTVLCKDMEHGLGCLPVYNQDIRLLKCKAGVEVSYPISTSSVTVGANLYLTPPGSQGLRIHFDDHCVFVCQLRGRKGWDVYPPLEQLPRLYSFKTLSSEVTQDCATHFDLQEWDTLYIPRGFLHEARTECPEQAMNVQIDGHDCPTSNSSEWNGASLHISFGVEVEPPFEWEGLLHMALRSWYYRSGRHTMPGKMYKICEILLHVAIRNVGKSCHVLRKACTLRSSTDAEAECSFHTMLKEVGVSAEFHSTIESYEVGVSWLDWLRHLSVAHNDNDEKSWGCEVLKDKNVVAQLEDIFNTMRCRFISEASFLESVKIRNDLLEKFRASREKLVSGFLALH